MRTTLNSNVSQFFPHVPQPGWCELLHSAQDGDLGVARRWQLGEVVATKVEKAEAEMPLTPL